MRIKNNDIRENGGKGSSGFNFPSFIHYWGAPEMGSELARERRRGVDLAGPFRQ